NPDVGWRSRSNMRSNRVAGNRPFSIRYVNSTKVTGEMKTGSPAAMAVWIATRAGTDKRVDDSRYQIAAWVSRTALDIRSPHAENCPTSHAALRQSPPRSCRIQRTSRRDRLAEA